MATPEIREKHSFAMRRYSDDDLLSDLRAQAVELGKTPSYREARRVTTYEERFGSYTNAVVAAGLIPNRLPQPSVDFAVKLSVRFRVLKRDNFRCQYCGATPESVQLQVDHVIARSNGGTNEESNLITSCWPCNVGKSDTWAPGSSTVERHRAMIRSASAYTPKPPLR